MPVTDPDNYVPEVLSMPRHSDPFVQKYLGGRSALMEEEAKKRSDAKFTASLTHTAHEACAIIRRLRAHEARTLWAQPPNYPGMPFAKARPLIEKSRLWRAMRRLPKGSLLHCHIDATMPLDYLFSCALEEEGMCMFANGPLTKETRDTETIGFAFAPKSARVNAPVAGEIWADGYKKGKKVPVAMAAETFVKGGRQGFLAWLTKRCSITPSEATSQQKGVDCVWRKFASTFPIIAGLFLYEPIFRKCVRKTLEELLADKVRWAEFRMVFSFPFRRRGQLKDEIGHEVTVRTLVEEIEAFKKSETGKGFWGARLIWTTLRSSQSSDILIDMEQCSFAKSAFPQLIMGYDLVGQEDAGRPLTSLLPELFFFKKHTATRNQDIPFFFHCGETLGSGSEADTNLFDAIILGSRRLGHAYSLYKHPLLMDLAKERHVLVEVCPISEEVLGLAHNISAHAAGMALINHGVACSLSSDDPAVLGYGLNGSAPGVSLDFYQALQGWEGLGLAGLGAMAENSVRWSCFEDQPLKEWETGIESGEKARNRIKGKRLRLWRDEWEGYCRWVVDEFGAEFGDGVTGDGDRPSWERDEDVWEDVDDEDEGDEGQRRVVPIREIPTMTSGKGAGG